MAAQLKDYLEQVLPLVERELELSLPGGGAEDSTYELAREYPCRGGKRMRGILVALSCEALGGRASLTFTTAAAFELFHSFALVHDDIEDDSLVRRGKPCLHRLHGVPLSINAGDVLFGKVFEVLGRNESLLGARNALKLVRQMAAGVAITLTGQAMDLEWTRDRKFPSVEEFISMARKKTGWYSGRGPCVAGATIAGSSRGYEEAMGDFGEALGIGFQIRDDLLSLTADSGQEGTAPGPTSGGYGKERGGDIAEGKRTLPILDLIGKCSPKEKKKVIAILDKKREENTEKEIEAVISLLSRHDCLAFAENKCRQFHSQAKQALRRIPASRERDLLEELCDFLMERKF